MAAAKRTVPLVSVLLTVTLATVAPGFAHKSICILEDFDDLKYRALCYTDIVPLYRAEGLRDSRIPYLEADNEYPVGTGALMWVASLVGRSEGGFFVTNAALLLLLALATTWVLYRLVGERALYFAAAPTLALSALVNWDLLPVALSTAAVAAFLRRRDRWAGVLLGLAVAAKAYPILFLVPLVADRLRSGERRRAGTILIATLGTVLLVNLPLAIAAFDRWSYFLRFSAQRGATPGTLWATTCRVVGASGDCGGGSAAALLSLTAFVALAWFAWTRQRAQDPGFPRWTLCLPFLIAYLLTSKVYSPQHSLWLLPWFALVLPDLRLFVAFEAADLMVFAMEFSYLRTLQQDGTMPSWPLDVAVLLRAAGLVCVLLAYARSRTRNAPERSSVQVRTKMSPSLSS